MRPFLILAVPACLLAGATASADCNLVPGNDMTAGANCGFETGNPPTGWFGDLADSFVQNTTTFRSGAASGAADAGQFGPNFMVVFSSPCFAGSAGGSYGAGAFLRLVSGAPTVCTAHLGPCGTPLEFSSQVSVDSTGWALVAVSGIDTSGWGPTFALSIGCQQQVGDYVVAIDDAFAGLTLTPVELLEFSVAD